MREVTFRFHKLVESNPTACREGATYFKWPNSNLFSFMTLLATGMVVKGVSHHHLMMIEPSTGVPINHWRFLLHLGMLLKIEFSRMPLDVYAVLPEPMTVLDETEAFRMRTLSDTQEMLRDPTAWMLRRSNTTEGVEDVISVRWTLLYLLAMLRLFLRCQYRLLPNPDTGWRRGVKMEMDLLSTLIPPRAAWPNCVRQIVDQFKVALDEDIDVGGFAGPTVNGGGSRPKPSPPQQPKVVDRRPERLLFYFTLPEFVEFRHLYKKNQFDYCLAVFTGDRVVLDTTLNENRLFALKGPIAECLQVATERKQQIRSSSVFQFGAVHDTFGTWKERVRNWLSQSV